MSTTPLLFASNDGSSNLGRTSNSNSATSMRNYSSIHRNPGNSLNQGYIPPSSSASGTSLGPYSKKVLSNTRFANESSGKKRHHTSKNPRVKKKHQSTKTSKLGTLDGVTLPTILNVLSILMFLRFGFVIGQMGILGTILLLLISYSIDLLTTLSISAIATNGIVKGGGAYYMLSRSLGVEFGGAIGVIFYIGQILNSSMNVAGLIEPILFNFSKENGVLLQILPSSYWWEFTYSTIFLFLCVVVALIGSSAVSRAGTYLCIILILSTLSVPISALFVKPFTSDYGIEYTGLSFKVFKDNLLPNFTEGAAGSQTNGVETFSDLFGIFFPATAGILAGASMSGDLKNPSKSIPKGTLNGLLITFVSYFIVIISMGCSIPRKLLYKDTQILQTINISPFIILAGEMSTSIFSVIVGIVGAAKLLQAIARDEILPGLKIFGRGDKNSDDPKEAIILTWIICQLFLFSDLNQIATFITMAFLMTFIVTNLSCALLKIGSAPNFRPSFKYFSTKSAIGGFISCLVAMFVVDGFSASIIFITLILLILVIHFVSTPKSWGDVSQSLIYHQVRKYLLKLRQDNVKYWRPQILLLVDNPRTSWKLISFCNNLKKGGLYILGHVFIIDKFQDNVSELGKSKENWGKIRDITKIKAFVQLSIAPTFSWGVRNIFVGSGLGGMKPNITIIAFYDLARYRGEFSIPQGIEFESLTSQFQKQVKIDINSLPTDERAKFAPKIKITEWVEVLEDLSLLNSNIAVAKGFPRLDLPNKENKFNEKKYIDLYPIQMAQKLDSGGTEEILTTNFDTCTLILQMGAILHTVPMWKENYNIRVIVFVENEEDVLEEHIRVKKLLEILRMQEAEIVVICLKKHDLGVYDYISRGETGRLNNLEKKRVDDLLQGDLWWNELLKIRQELRSFKFKRDDDDDDYDNGDGRHAPRLDKLRMSLSVPNATNGGNYSVATDGDAGGSRNMGGLTRRMTMSRINQIGVSFGNMSFQANKLSSNEIRNVFGSNEEEFTDLETDSNSLSDMESVKSNQSVISSRSVRDGNAHSHTCTHNKKEHIPQLKHSLSSNSSLKRIKNSAFTAERMPKSRINEDASGNEASIIFEVEEKRHQAGDKGTGNGVTGRGDAVKKCDSREELCKARMPRSMRDREQVDGGDKPVRKDNGSRDRRSGDGEEADSGEEGTEEESGDEDWDQQEEGAGDGDGRRAGAGGGEGETDHRCDKESRLEEVGVYRGNVGSVGGGSHGHASDNSAAARPGEVAEEFDISFSEMSRRCQFLVVNEIIRSTSLVGQTGLVFSTLPVPEVGLHHNEKESLNYVVDLAIFTTNSPPVLLMNAKTVTVTSAL